MTTKLMVTIAEIPLFLVFSRYAVPGTMGR